MYSFNKYLLIFIEHHQIPDTILGNGDTLEKRRPKKNPAPEPTDFNFNYTQRTGQEISKMNLKHLVVIECKKVLQKEFQQWVHDKEIQKSIERAHNGQRYNNFSNKIKEYQISPKYTLNTYKSILIEGEQEERKNKFPKKKNFK